jgi:hypothetical protein
MARALLEAVDPRDGHRRRTRPWLGKNRSSFISEGRCERRSASKPGAVALVIGHA